LAAERLAAVTHVTGREKGKRGKSLEDFKVGSEVAESISA